MTSPCRASSYCTELDLGCCSRFVYHYGTWVSRTVWRPSPRPLYPSPAPTRFRRYGASSVESVVLASFLLFQEAFMGKKLYVGNLTYDVTDAALEQLFAAHGSVQSAQVIMDRDTGRSKGFGFVEMSNDQEAQNAIAALNGQQHGGRSLTVNEAKPREDRGNRGGHGGGRGGYGGGRRY